MELNRLPVAFINSSRMYSLQLRNYGKSKTLCKAPGAGKRWVTGWTTGFRFPAGARAVSLLLSFQTG
jgi:hypothetical protein